MIRTMSPEILDTREQKSPRQLLDYYPKMVSSKLSIGDIRYHEKLCEYKDTGDISILKTETMERIFHELSRMYQWGLKNPDVQLHCIHREEGIWANPYRVKKDGTKINQIRVFYRICQKWQVIGHVIETWEELYAILKTKYEVCPPYIKRSHEEPTILAKMLRQFPRISSEMAMKLDKNFRKWGMKSIQELFQNDEYEPKLVLHYSSWQAIIEVIGRKKNGNPKKLALDLKHWLETGDEP